MNYSYSSLMNCDAKIDIEDDDSHDDLIVFDINAEQQHMTEHNDSTFNFTIDKNGNGNSLQAKIEKIQMMFSSQ